MLQSTSKEWRSVFIVSAEIYVFGVIIFTLLAKGNVQPWAITNTRGYESLSSSDSEDHPDDDYHNSVNHQVTSDTTD